MANTKKSEEEYWTYPAETEDGLTLIITGRDGIDNIRTAGHHRYRVEVAWDYEALPDGLPDEPDAELLEDVTEALRAETASDPAAVLTGIYTGGGRREWVFYTRSLHIFNKILNRALCSLPQMPLRIEAYDDPLWEEYLDMKENTFIR